MRSSFFKSLSALIMMSAFVFGQTSTQGYRNDPKGDFKYRREGIMDGNRVRTAYYNYGMVGNWNSSGFHPTGEWPKGSGHEYLDGVSVLVAAQVTAPGNGQVIHVLESQYREEMDQDPVTGLVWGFEPVPGYFNPTKSNSTNSPAINIDTSTFPTVWPAALGLPPEWNGYWYGYFGRGVTNADFETFFVMDDSKDGEFKRAPYKYYPIASDSDRGGLGLRVEVRGFQWSHVLAEDIIFWHYDIVNISDHDYDSTCFGFYSDPGVGGNGSGNDDASYSTLLDLCYAWDHIGTGDPALGSWKTGYYAYAFLESPGNSYNGIDDDEDGLIDETRDNGIDDNHNWVPFTDANNNGVWDKGEELNDDLGADGVGPYDPQYNGPDVGEGDGKPTAGEPNFDATDKDESDQIGLGAVSLTPLSDKSSNGVWPKNDEVVWRKMTGGFVDTGITNANISIVFASGPFPLKKGKRERYSMALIFGNNLDQIVFNKITVQSIYNANYNFSSPPLRPHLTAVPGDKRVFLYWDNIAENSYDRFLKRKDFEGYMVYRSREAEFNDIKVVTDSKGEPKFWKPIAQFDYKDTIYGPDPIGINGAHFWRGSNTGLQHSFVDTTVQNGYKYYYAVVSYDKGDSAYGTTGLQPTECTKIITEDVNGQLKFIDINCAIVTPNAAAAGYIPPLVNGNLNAASGIGTGSISVSIVNPAAITQGNAYKIIFDSTGTFPSYSTRSLSVVRKVSGKTDTLLSNILLSDVSNGKYSPAFDGMTLTVSNDNTVAIDTAGWLVGNSNIVMTPDRDFSIPSISVAWPSDYEIDYFDSNVDTSFSDGSAKYPAIPVPFTITNITQGHKVDFLIDDADLSTTLSSGDTIRIVEGDILSGTFYFPWHIVYVVPPVGTTSNPQPGDKFIVRTTKPFAGGDYFAYTTNALKNSSSVAKGNLDKIGVVPNPYVSAASWEPKTIYGTGRGDRKIDFIHLPSKCTIRIYTLTGVLVKTLYKDSPATDGSMSWDLISEDGTDVAYGLYIYHVDAPGVGTHIGKFALIK